MVAQGLGYVDRKRPLFDRMDGTNNCQKAARQRNPEFIVSVPMQAELVEFSLPRSGLGQTLKTLVQHSSRKLVLP